MRNDEHAEGLQIILFHTNYRWPSGHTRKLAVAGGYIEPISGMFKQLLPFSLQAYYSLHCYSSLMLIAIGRLLPSFFFFFFSPC